ncbi:MAG TPA: hypothetical protein VM536_12945, partial [Chloroflexia bacterium]|nr:hypothetical protein [Chloroflexia bacterium]
MRISLLLEVRTRATARSSGDASVVARFIAASPDQDAAGAPGRRIGEAGGGGWGGTPDESRNYQYAP